MPHGVGGHSFRGSPPGYLHGTPPGGPLMKRLAGEYEKATGLDPKKEHGKWNIVGKTLLARVSP